MTTSLPAIQEELIIVDKYVIDGTNFPSLFMLIIAYCSELFNFPSQKMNTRTAKSKISIDKKKNNAQTHFFIHFKLQAGMMGIYSMGLRGSFGYSVINAGMVWHLTRRSID